MHSQTPNTDGQTPLYAAERLVERHFPDLGAKDLVLEPSCGIGAFLRAIPATTSAIGVEIDPERAAIARQRSGRPVITGDFCSVHIDARPTAIIGNPPFRMRTIERFLDRSHDLLPENGRVGFILPAYVFGTAATVVRLNDRWSIAQEIIPRNMFGRLYTPLVFAVFSKDFRRTLVGFAMHADVHSVTSLPAAVRLKLIEHPRPIWRTVVEDALRRLGGEADLDRIYAEVEGRQPTGNRFWRDKIRQVCHESFMRTGRGRYALPRQEAA